MFTQCGPTPIGRRGLLHIHNFASSRSLVGPHGLMRINNLTSTRSHVGPRGRILNPTSQKCRFVEMKKATSIRATQNKIMSQQKKMEKGTRHTVFPFLFGCCEDCTQEDERIVTSDTVSKYKDGDARSSHWLRLQPHLIIRKKGWPGGWRRPAQANVHLF